MSIDRRRLASHQNLVTANPSINPAFSGTAGLNARERRALASQHDLQAVMRDFPAGRHRLGPLGRVVEDHRVAVVDVNEDFRLMPSCARAAMVPAAPETLICPCVCPF